MKNTLLSVLAVSTLSLFDLGCSEAERTYDCAQICDKYQDCHDDDIDKSDCVDTCEDKAENDAGFEEDVDRCENCLDSTSCTEATASCTDECAFIIAEST